MTPRPLRFAQLPKATSLLLCCAAYAIACASACVAGRAFAGANPLVAAGAADLAATVTVFLASVLLDNSSVYDPFWSVAPAGIAVYFACQSNTFPAARQVLVLALVAVWAARLTWNWVLRWRGMGDEDWRYADFRSNRAYWAVSFAGFHLFPTVAVFAGCLPLAAVLLFPAHPPGIVDGCAFCVTCAGIAVEMKADKDLRVFRRRPRDRPALLTDGIWSWCRHPNYLGEVMFWWGIGLFGIAAGVRWWTLAGAVLISALFLFISIPLMDGHMLKRYPEYRDRMKNVPGFLPLGLFRR
jgi:steroid 5-alpha reductase family enzyme